MEPDACLHRTPAWRAGLTLVPLPSLLPLASRVPGRSGGQKGRTAWKGCLALASKVQGTVLPCWTQ